MADPEAGRLDRGVPAKARVVVRDRDDVVPPVRPAGRVPRPRPRPPRIVAGRVRREGPVPRVDPDEHLRHGPVRVPCVPLDGHGPAHGRARHGARDRHVRMCFRDHRRGDEPERGARDEDDEQNHGNLTASLRHASHLDAGGSPGDT